MKGSEVRATLPLWARFGQQRNGLWQGKAKRRRREFRNPAPDHLTRRNLRQASVWSDTKGETSWAACRGGPSSHPTLLPSPPVHLL